MDAWWISMSSIEQVYWGIAIAASIVLAIQIPIALSTGLEVHDGDIATHHGADGGGDFQLLTIRNAVAYFAVMGWSGLSLISMKVPVLLIVGLSCFFGFAMMMVSALIFYAISRLQSSGTLNLSQAIGKKASVYLTIPSASSLKGIGKIEVILQGRKVEIDAWTSNPEEIKTGSLVIITEIVDGKAVVELVAAPATIIKAPVCPV